MKTVGLALPEMCVNSSSLCSLSVLCVSVVNESLGKTTTETQRTRRLHSESSSNESFGAKRVGLFLALTFVMLSLSGCNVRLPGKPTEAERWRAPADVSDFNQLYQENCAGCHGADGRRGVALALNDSLYLAFVSDAALQEVIADGRAGTNMPAFSEKAGGSLTEKQIELLINGIRSKWSRPDDFKGQELPRYSVNNQSPDSSATQFSPADPGKGAAAYQTYCASCHGPQGTGGSAGSIVDPHFLTMVSDQSLRTTVVVGRADLGKPDWRSNQPGRAMSPQEIDDVVAWLISHRQLDGTKNQISQTSLR